MKLNLIIILFLALGFNSYSQGVHTVSAMKKVMMGIDLDAHLSWDTLEMKNMYAVAPLGRIEGEVTVIDGKFYAARVQENGEITISNSTNETSPFAVYTYVESWDTIIWENEIKSELDLQKMIEEIAVKSGRNLQEPFVFRVSGLFKQMDFHVISKPTDEKEHNHELHNKAKIHFRSKKVIGELVGFYSQNHEGVFTHKGQFIHTHFINENKTEMGHVENLRSHKKLIVLVPRIN